MPSCWVEVDLAAIGENFRAVQKLVGDGVQLIAVVKANAYGHGAVEVSRALESAGVKCLAVTRVEEAIPIREAGVLAPLLLLAPAPPGDEDEIVARDLTACVSNFEDAVRLSDAAQKQGRAVRAHLKIDTGMNRFGVAPREAVEISKRIAALPHLRLEAAFTHFAFAGGSARGTPKVVAQFASFEPLVKEIASALQISPMGFHCANSAAILRFPEMRLSCVRAGTILYGQMPSALASEAAKQHGLKLQNTFQAKARVLSVREVQAGASVGYGGEWTARRKKKIAVIGIGFADGFSQEPQTRVLSALDLIKNCAHQILKSQARAVKIRNQSAPIVGRIAMQTCAVEVTKIEGVAVGDEVMVSLRRTSAVTTGK
jgi:alanine racemase